MKTPADTGCSHSQSHVITWYTTATTLTFAALAMTAAIIKTEKIHNILWWLEEGVAGVPGPEGRVGGHCGPAVLLDPLQVEHSIPCVTSILKLLMITNINN